LVVKHIAIIGLGSIGCRHLRILRELRPAINITVVRTGKGVKSEDEKLADKVVFSLDEAIKSDIQAAIISTPASIHVDQASAIAKAGVHLFVEKPLSHKLDNLNELRCLIQKNEIITLVGYVLRYHPAAKFFKELFDKNIIGEILYVSVECGSYLPDWRPGKNYKTSVSANKDFGGGVLLELSHELDYIRWIFGEINNIYAQIDNSGTLDINVEDSANLIISTETNHSINVHLDFNRRFPTRRCVIHGTKGYLKWDLLEQKVSWHLVGDEINNNLFSFENDYIYQLQLEHFLDCLENGISPLVTFEDGFETLRLVESAKKSNKIGKRIFL
jgi:predicted dehydrogenase